MGIAWITFDSGSKSANGSSRIFVGVANMGADNIFVSEDAGSSWSALAGQRNEFIPHHGNHLAPLFDCEMGLTHISSCIIYSRRCPLYSLH